MTDLKLKIPPSSKEAEMMVLGCMLSSINSLNSASDLLDDSDFYFNEHKIIFSILKTLWKKDMPADVHIVGEELKKKNKLEESGGAIYLMTLTQFAGTSAYIDHYCEIVKCKAMVRKMIFSAQEIEKKCFQGINDVALALDEAQKAFFEIGQKTSRDCGKTIGDVLNGIKSESQKPFLKELVDRQEFYQQIGHQQGGVTGVRTHFIDLDKMLNGFANSNLMILAARPSMGKTAFAINLAENICMKSNIPVGVFSLEMSAEQLIHRLVCSRSKISSEKIKTGNVTGLEIRKVAACISELVDKPIIIEDQPNLTINDVRSRARRMKECHGIGFLVIDYLQLITSSSNRQENRQVEVSEISRMLKNLARELNIPILCLSQLSRKVEERDSKRPQMSDLRESGAIEQDADVIMFMMRPEYYKPDNRPGYAELIIGKNRHGPVGSIDLTYRKELAQFDNFIKDRSEVQ